jgi:predicted porin
MAQFDPRRQPMRLAPHAFTALAAVAVALLAGRVYQPVRADVPPPMSAQQMDLLEVRALAAAGAPTGLTAPEAVPVQIRKGETFEQAVRRTGISGDEARAVAATVAAMAQSSVTLFGIVDLNYRNVSQGGKTLATMAQDGIASSRLGFRGTEDLGGGMKASFWLEAALQPDVGTSAALQFQRRSTMSVEGGFGEIRLGRDYTPTFWNHTVYDPFGTNGVGSSVNTFGVLGSGTTTLVRANNSIGYFTPTMGGFQAQVMTTVKESKDTNTANEYTGFRVTYNAGPLSAAVATATEGSTSAAASFKRTNVGVAYNMGFARPMFQYTTAEFGASKVKHYMVGAVVPMGATNIKASYTNTDYTGANDATQLAIGADYSLSKRTAMYATFARINNDGAATFSVPGGVGTAAAGGSSRGFEVGVRHSF